MTVRQTRAERAASPLARDAIRKSPRHPADACARCSCAAPTLRPGRRCQ